MADGQCLRPLRPLSGLRRVLQELSPTTANPRPGAHLSNGKRLPSKAELFALARTGEGSDLLLALSLAASSYADQDARSPSPTTLSTVSSPPLRKLLSGVFNVRRAPIDAELHVDAIADEKGETLLHVACQSGQTEVAQVLVQLGADLRARSAVTTTALTHYNTKHMCRDSVSMTASGSQKDRRHSISCGGYVNSTGTATESTPSCNVATGRDLRRTSSENASAGDQTPQGLVIEHGGQTSLHFAARSGHVQLVRWILRQRPPPAWSSDACVHSLTYDDLLNSRAGDGSTPLHCCLDWRAEDLVGPSQASERQLSTLKELLAGGADPDAASGSRRRWCSALGRRSQCLKWRLTAGLTPLHCAVDRGDVVAVHCLLTTATGCHVDARTRCHGSTCDAGRTALHFAAEQLNVECVAALLDAGADPNALDIHQASPLHCALSPAHDLLVNTFASYSRRAAAHCVTSAESLRWLDADECEDLATARTAVVQLLLEAGASRYTNASCRAARDPCLAQHHRGSTGYAVRSPGCPSLCNGDGHGGDFCAVSPVDLAMADSCLGGREVLMLLGKCFARPPTLAVLCKRVARALQRQQSVRHSQCQQCNPKQQQQQRQEERQEQPEKQQQQQQQQPEQGPQQPDDRQEQPEERQQPGKQQQQSEEQKTEEQKPEEQKQEEQNQQPVDQ
ncbi:serine/threonine-protein phosphatase 6 regulatory ankyrin repeat subunit C-like [Sycon ciliatum]|uniref:serine/threonine-protein phosphatase 6 regulatory ankyrin repeat subunit C-like n=1 Tax=Sycon ciliatum TaxID=27933 RepID=UPI0031F5F4D6